MTLKQRAEKASEVIQALVDAGHTTLARFYDHKLPDGTTIPRLGISVYADRDTVEALGNPSEINKQTGEVLTQGTGLLSELQAYRMSDKNNPVIPITVTIAGIEFNAVSTQFSEDPNNFSKKDKILLAEVLTSSNAEVSTEERDAHMQQLIEQRKNLRQQTKVSAPTQETEKKVPIF